MTTQDMELTPAERVNDLARMLDAMTSAVRDALRRHKQAGNPIAVWRDGQVVWLQPDEITIDDDPE